MAITYGWTFPAFDVAPSEGGLSNVVKAVHWRLRASEGGYSAETYGSSTMPEAGQPFTDYADLTPEIVSGWVVSALGADEVANMRSNLAGQIEAMKSPPVVMLPPPWG